MLLVYFGLSPFVSALLVGAVAVVIGLVIGLITLRTRGPAFIISTVALLLMMCSAGPAGNRPGRDQGRGRWQSTRGCSRSWPSPSVAFWVAVAGALWGYSLSYLRPTVFLTIAVASEMVLMVIIGGNGTVAGPVVGAVLLVFVNEFSIARFGSSELNIVVTGLLLIVLLFFPAGIVGEPARTPPVAPYPRLKLADAPNRAELRSCALS